MATPKPAPLPFADKDVSAEIRRWLGHLGAERRMSPKTCEAYRRDVHQFLAFLAEHLGQRVTLSALARLAPADVRAFMAARRAHGICGRPPLRRPARARPFSRFFQRHHKGKGAAPSAGGAPPTPQNRPKTPPGARPPRTP